MASIPHLSPIVRIALDRLGSQLRSDLGPRLVQLRMFGSYARGEATEDSDVDVCVVVRDLDFETRKLILDRATTIFLDTDVPLSPTVLDEDTYRTWDRPDRG